MATERKNTRKPRTVRPFIFDNNLEIIRNNGLDLIKGQGEIVLSVLQTRPGLWNSRELSGAISTYPEVSGALTSPDRIANYWICKFKKFGLIRNAR